MARMLASLSQVAVMAAIVATLFYVPAGLLITLVVRIIGFPLDAFVTFGGAFNTFVGLIVWWLLAFAGACAYAAFTFPWHEEVMAWPRKS
jgi:hypothetical protein